MRITEPGIYRNAETMLYLDDPCPQPSLTQSLCKILNDQSPRHAWTAHPRLNPNFERDDDTKFDLGNVAHALMLGRGKDLLVLPFDDWRKKDAQAAREAWHSSGHVAVLQHQFERAVDMNDAALDQLARHEDKDAFQNGSAEVMLAWHEGGIWFRSLVDWLHDDLRTVDDYKTSGMSMAPHLLGIRAEGAGWHIQAAFIERGLDVLDPAGAGRRKFRFIGQETDKPHALNVMHMNEYWLTMGRKQVDTAVTRWRHAIESGNWSGYPTHGITPDFPGYKEKQWLERELAGDFDPMNDHTLTMAG